jgi:transposase-like protein
MAEQKQKRPGRYPDEVRQRAVRMVFEHANEHVDCEGTRSARVANFTANQWAA